MLSTRACAPGWPQNGQFFAFKSAVVWPQVWQTRKDLFIFHPLRLPAATPPGRQANSALRQNNTGIYFHYNPL